MTIRLILDAGTIREREVLYRLDQTRQMLFPEVLGELPVAMEDTDLNPDQLTQMVATAVQVLR